jgi:hypothetical protein
MTSPVRSVTVPGIQQAKDDIVQALSDGNASKQAVETERGNLRAAYQSQQAWPILDGAIQSWESTFDTILAELQTFQSQLETAGSQYATGDSLATDEATRARQQVGTGLPGF